MHIPSVKCCWCIKLLVNQCTCCCLCYQLVFSAYLFAVLSSSLPVFSTCRTTARDHGAQMFEWYCTSVPHHSLSHSLAKHISVPLSKICYTYHSTTSARTAVVLSLLLVCPPGIASQALYATQTPPNCFQALNKYISVCTLVLTKGIMEVH